MVCHNKLHINSTLGCNNSFKINFLEVFLKLVIRINKCFSIQAGPQDFQDSYNNLILQQYPLKTI